MSRSSRSSVKDKAGIEDVGEAWLCVGCKKEFKDPNSRLLECERCADHYCTRCMKINDAEYDFLNARNDIHWYCDSCEPKVLKSIQLDKEIDKKLEILMAKVDDRMTQMNKDIESVKENSNAKIQAVMDEMKSVGKLQDRVSKFEERQDETETELKKVKVIIQEIDNKLAREVNKARQDMDSSLRTIDFRDIMKQQLDEEVQSKVDDTIKKEFLSHVNDELDDVHKTISETREHADKLRMERLEQEDIESRRCNIILYRVPESNEVLAEDRKKNDIKFCEQFLRSFSVGFDNDDIRKVQRLGSRAEAHIRPILIQLGTRHMKNLIMESLYKIKSMDAKFKSLIVAHDMTKKQREECKSLVAEAKAKSDEESGDWIYKVRGQPGQMRIIKIRRLNQ